MNMGGMSGMRSTGNAVGETRLKRSVGGKAKMPKLGGKPKKMRPIGLGDMQMSGGKKLC